MKTLLCLLILMCSLHIAAQKTAYGPDGEKVDYTTEDIDIEYSDSALRIPHNQSAALLAAIPTAVDIVFRLVQSQLEKHEKKFSAEYSKQKSYIDAGKQYVPDFTFVRKIDDNEALSVSFKAKDAPGIKGFYYDADVLNLAYSSAKATKKHLVFDYIFEIKVTYLLEDGEKKVQELAPLTIYSVKFGKTDFPENKHRTDIIPKPDNAAISEISIKIIETNSGKVRAEKILALWNDNKDDVKTIINNFLPEGNQSETTDDSNDDANTDSEGENSETTNPER